MTFPPEHKTSTEDYIEALAYRALCNIRPRTTTDRDSTGFLNHHLPSLLLGSSSITDHRPPQPASASPLLLLLALRFLVLTIDHILSLARKSFLYSSLVGFNPPRVCGIHISNPSAALNSSTVGVSLAADHPSMWPACLADGIILRSAAVVQSGCEGSFFTTESPS
ncbi:hypothetical protein P175DRAFT_0560897 [Aspergillus ochraceoroseus IBT 24754]|uniref:Uncharacterized protein n=1 Tax=Aspergillus ochraceoroseus IBT 24754 TaxID=1392256 RepID=A0A2T5LLQ0_9EURO|nr:uncharacterized protein P175DRAFT_0560897 [Aspergillus ochraceoroseus IBT 24754]PTU17216.1 hypothetical protein P175DRAFT_0560897 [Aspergillus ochraceoroseus IBT 24754]